MLMNLFGVLVFIGGRIHTGIAISIKSCGDASVDVPGSIYKMRTYDCLKKCEQSTNNQEGKLLSFIDDFPGYSKSSQCCCIHDVDKPPYLDFNDSIETSTTLSSTNSTKEGSIVFDCRANDYYEDIVAPMCWLERQRVVTACDYLKRSEPLSLIEVKHLISLLLDIQDNYYYNPDLLAYNIIVNEQVKNLMNSKSLWWGMIKEIALPVEPELMNDKKFCSIYSVDSSVLHVEKEIKQKSQTISEFVKQVRGQDSVIIDRAINDYLSQIKRLCLSDVSVQNRETMAELEMRREEAQRMAQRSFAEKKVRLAQQASGQGELAPAKPFIIKKKLRVDLSNVGGTAA